MYFVNYILGSCSAKKQFWQQQLAYTGMEINRERHVIEQILRELRVKEIQQDLAYYTSMDTFFKMLPAEL